MQATQSSLLSINDIKELVDTFIDKLKPVALATGSILLIYIDLYSKFCAVILKYFTAVDFALTLVKQCDTLKL